LFFLLIGLLLNKKTLFSLEPLNRFSIEVVPKEMFWEWVKNVETKLQWPPLKKEDRGPSNIYLIPPSYFGQYLDDCLEKNFEVFFQNELNMFVTDPDFWPSNRTYEMFTNWFDVKISDMVWGLEEYTNPDFEFWNPN